MHVLPRNMFGLSIEQINSPTTDSSSIATVSTSTVYTTDPTRGNAASAFVEVSPLSYQSVRGRSNQNSFISARGPRSQRTNSLSEIEVPILAPLMRQGYSNSAFSPTSPDCPYSMSADAAAPSLLFPSSMTVAQMLEERGSASPVTLRTSSPSCQSSLGPPDGALVEMENTYVPPRCYHPERLLYTFVFLGFLVRSYYVGCTFFTANILQLRRGVGPPNRFLAAILPTVGYDGGLDRQWMSYLNSLPALLLLAAALGGATRLVHYLAQRHPLAGRPPTPQRTQTAAPWWRFSKLFLRDRDAQLLQRSLYLLVGVVFIAIVHGPHFFMPLLLTLANYVVFTRLQRWCSYRVFMAVMWATHITLLYVIELYEGFENTYVLQYYFPTDEALASRVLGRPAKPLWSTNLRWYVAFRMTTLRLIAFNYDLWEATHCAAQARERAADRHDTACIECAQLREQNSSTSSTGNSTASVPAEASRCYKYRTECARDAADYSLVNYLAYVVFPPLYLAGPMSSFNAFVSHMRVPSTAMPPRKMALYGVRTICLFLVAYLHLHFWFIVALSERMDILLEASPEFQSYVLFYYLAYLWLKFNIIWKSSRLFAMFSGIEVPEDMRRCFANTTTVRNFWRDWHASFNLWIVRYMYVPMGGRPRVALSVLPIFLFIALWHDPALHLIKWALCIAVMFVVELAVSACFGALVAVFSREMAAAAAARNDSEGAPFFVSEARPSRRWSRRTMRPIAQWAQRCLSPFQRGTLYRELVTVGCFFSVFGLIVANMVGFCVQNNAAEVKGESATDSLILRALRIAKFRYYVGLVAILYSAAGLGVSMWMWEGVVERQQRGRYGLRSRCPPPPPRVASSSS